MHGREQEAEAAVEQIERATERTGGKLADVDESKAIEITPATDIGFVALAHTLFARYPKRSILGATLMITQSFLYNAIFFTYALVLTKIYNVPSKDTPYYFIFFALGNLDRAVDDRASLRHDRAPAHDRGNLHSFRHAAGRRARSCFNADVLNAVSQTACWCVIFFFASAGASAAYLTVSEIFPVEVRAKAIAVFFAIAQMFRRHGAMALRDADRQRSRPFKLFVGYLIGAGVMIVGGIVEIIPWRGGRTAAPRGHRQPAVGGAASLTPPVQRDRRAPTASGSGNRLLISLRPATDLTVAVTMGRQPAPCASQKRLSQPWVLTTHTMAPTKGRSTQNPVRPLTGLALPSDA